jgi:hypothetical protein
MGAVLSDVEEGERGSLVRAVERVHGLSGTSERTAPNRIVSWAALEVGHDHEAHRIQQGRERREGRAGGEQGITAKSMEWDSVTWGPCVGATRQLPRIYVKDGVVVGSRRATCGARSACPT